jgi:type IV pilus assembly protein PilA
MKENHKNKTRTRGFTLVEIIVVLVILAILAAFTIPAMLGFVEDARAKASIPVVREIYEAAQISATEWVGTKGSVPVHSSDKDKDKDYQAFWNAIRDSINKKLGQDTGFKLGSLSLTTDTDVLDVSLSNKNFIYPYTSPDKYLPQQKNCCLIVIGGFGAATPEEQAKVRLISYVDKTGTYRTNLKVNDKNGSENEITVQKKVNGKWTDI